MCFRSLRKATIARSLNSSFGLAIYTSATKSEASFDRLLRPLLDLVQQDAYAPLERPSHIPFSNTSLILNPYPLSFQHIMSELPLNIPVLKHVPMLLYIIRPDDLVHIAWGVFPETLYGDVPCSGFPSRLGFGIGCAQKELRVDIWMNGCHGGWVEEEAVQEEDLEGRLGKYGGHARFEGVDEVR